jgi:hypothetical protein
MSDPIHVKTLTNASKEHIFVVLNKFAETESEVMTANVRRVLEFTDLIVKTLTNAITRTYALLIPPSVRTFPEVIAVSVRMVLKMTEVEKIVSI